MCLESSSPGMPMQSHRHYVLLTFRSLGPKGLEWFSQITSSAAATVQKKTWAALVWYYAFAPFGLDGVARRWLMSQLLRVLKCLQNIAASKRCYVVRVVSLILNLWF